MANNGKISDAKFKKYTTILNEVIKGLTSLCKDLKGSLCDGNRIEAKLKIAVVNLTCIDRKYRNLLYDGEPPEEHYTIEHLERKKKEREEIIQKLNAIRDEYYMQEEHTTKLTSNLQDNERRLAMQSIQCIHEGLLISRLLWSATKTRRVLEKLTSKCAQDLNDFLNLAEGCIYAFSVTYKDSEPDPSSDEYQYVTALCGILTNLSSIPEGRLFLMWNPMGRAIYTLVMDIMGTITSRKTGSLKWMILIMIYNILVNPFGRKFILKHPLLRENLEGCLEQSNSSDIIGAALHITDIFVDDFIEDDDMVSVLMYQLPFKQIYFLSKYSKDINIHKLAQTIVSKMRKRTADYYNCPSCSRAVLSTTHKSKKPKLKKPKQKLVTKSIMTSDISICAECETDDTDYDASVTNELNMADESTSCTLYKSPKKDKRTKKSFDKQNEICGEILDTPSLRAKGTKKLVVKTLFKPTASKSLDRSIVELRGHSTGRLEGIPPLRPKSKSEEIISQGKLMNVDRKTVIDMLSKLDLDKYLRPSYDEFGIPLKTDDYIQPSNVKPVEDTEKKACNENAIKDIMEDTKSIVKTNTVVEVYSPPVERTGQSETEKPCEACEALNNKTATEPLKAIESENDNKGKCDELKKVILCPEITDSLKENESAVTRLPNISNSGIMFHQTISTGRVRSSSAVPGTLSVHSKVIIRKVSSLKLKRKSGTGEVAENIEKKLQDLCSCPESSKIVPVVNEAGTKSTNCGDNCTSCSITLPNIDIAKLPVNENKNNDIQKKVEEKVEDRNKELPIETKVENSQNVVVEGEEKVEERKKEPPLESEITNSQNIVNKGEEKVEEPKKDPPLETEIANSQNLTENNESKDQNKTDETLDDTEKFISDQTTLEMK